MAYKDKATPFYAKLVCLFVVAYALSPIDLIPDFIPVLGYLDDLILLPLGIYLAIKLIPREVLERCKNQVEEVSINKIIKNIGAFLVILLWIALLLFLATFLK